MKRGWRVTQEDLAFYSIPFHHRHQILYLCFIFRPDENLVENIEVQVEHPTTGVELDEVFNSRNNSIEDVLNNPDWVEDAT